MPKQVRSGLEQAALQSIPSGEAIGAYNQEMAHERLIAVNTLEGNARLRQEGTFPGLLSFGKYLADLNREHHFVVE